jgi:mono/diheme cytochrome c family protein
VLLEITTLGKTTLLVVAGVFIAWALITAIFIPKRNTEFPFNLNAYIVASAVLFFAQMGAVLWVTGTQEVESEEHGLVEPGSGDPTEPVHTEPAETVPAETVPVETEPAETVPVETEPAPTEPVETEAAETEPPDEDAAGDPTVGEGLYASAGCGGCHTLADAGSTGAVGPNLDEASSSYDKVVERVTDGQGGMPAFKDRLSEQEIQDVAAYVFSVTDS